MDHWASFCSRLASHRSVLPWFAGSRQLAGTGVHLLSFHLLVHICTRCAQGEAGRDALRAVVGAGEFFAATLPDGSRLVQPIPRGVRHPLNFGREVRPGLGCRHLTGSPFWCTGWRAVEVIFKQPAMRAYVTLYGKPAQRRFVGSMTITDCHADCQSAGAAPGVAKPSQGTIAVV